MYLKEGFDLKGIHSHNQTLHC